MSENDQAPDGEKLPGLSRRCPLTMAAETGTQKVITGALHHRAGGHHRRNHQRHSPGQVRSRRNSGWWRELAGDRQALCSTPRLNGAAALRKPSNCPDPGSAIDGVGLWPGGAAGELLRPWTSPPCEQISPERICMSLRCGRSHFEICPAGSPLMEPGHWLREADFTALRRSQRQGLPRCVKSR